MDTANKLLSFHLVFDRALVAAIKSEARRKKCSFSAVINTILEEVFELWEKVDCIKPVIFSEEFHETGLVMEVERKVKILKIFKRMLFQFQAHFQLRSKASVLRFIVRKYFEKQKIHGELRVRTICRKAVRNWQIRKTLQKIWEREKVTHMEEYRIEVWTKSCSRARIILIS